MIRFPHKKIIAFEGLDNCFKETNYNEFVRRLKKKFPEEKDYHILTESFPRYGNWSSIGLEKWLDGSFDRKSLKNYPDAINSLYCIDRLSYWYESVHGKEPMIKTLDENNENVCFVFDRYTLSNPIYNPTIRNQCTEHDFTFDRDTFGIPTADIIVWLRMRDFEVLKKLIAAKENKDENELDTSFLKRAWERSELVIHNKHVFDITQTKLIIIELLDSNDNIKSRSQLADEIWNTVIKEF